MIRTEQKTPNPNAQNSILHSNSKVSGIDHSIRCQHVKQKNIFQTKLIPWIILIRNIESIQTPTFSHKR